jgi:hypothetical protein
VTTNSTFNYLTQHIFFNRSNISHSSRSSNTVPSRTSPLLPFQLDPRFRTDKSLRGRHEILPQRQLKVKTSQSLSSQHFSYPKVQDWLTHLEISNAPLNHAAKTASVHATESPPAEFSRYRSALNQCRVTNFGRVGKILWTEYIGGAGLYFAARFCIYSGGL